MTGADFARASRRLAEHSASLPTIHLNIPPATAIALVGTLQLAMRHSDFAKRPTCEVIRQTTDKLIEAVAQGDPEIERLLRLGDNPAHDC